MTLRQHDEGLAAKGGRPSHDTENKPVLARVEVEAGHETRPRPGLCV